MDIKQEALKKHYEWQGKIEITPRAHVTNSEELSLAYTPGVAEPCLAIRDDYEKSYLLTRRANMVAVITDGSAILGLGDIGPEAGMPVMEGKCVLFKEFAGVDAFPLCVRTKDVDELVRTIYLISGSFGGINLEDIAAPRCFEVERRLKEICDIPVFHDDQHGTAVVVAAALLNALKVVGKTMETAKVVINGAGSAGVAIGKHLMNLGVKDLIMVDRFGILCEGMEGLNPAHEEMSRRTNPRRITGTLADAMRGADVFIGGRGGCRQRPQRLQKPDQQRAGVPRHFPRRARLPRQGHQRGDEGCGELRDCGACGRRRAERGLHHPQGV